MLINLSNHPLISWETVQRQTAELLFGEVQDLAFPYINPNSNEEEISLLADQYFEKIKDLQKGKENFAVHLMGELCFCFSLAERLKKYGIKTIASTTERKVIENGNQKTAVFNFVKFRAY